MQSISKKLDGGKYTIVGYQKGSDKLSTYLQFCKYAKVSPSKYIQRPFELDKSDSVLEILVNTGGDGFLKADFVEITPKPHEDFYLYNVQIRMYDILGTIYLNDGMGYPQTAVWDKQKGWLVNPDELD